VEPKAPAQETIEFSGENARQIWQQAVKGVGGLAAEMALQSEQVAILAPNRLVVSFPEKYSFTKQRFDRPEEKQRIESELRRVTGVPVAVEFTVVAAEGASPRRDEPRRGLPTQQLLRQAAEAPLVRRAMELFGGVPTRVDPPRHQA
jgi:hypothetical protein